MIVKIILNSTEVEKAIASGSLLALAKGLKENDVKTEDVSSPERSVTTKDDLDQIDSVPVASKVNDVSKEESVAPTVPTSAKAYTRDELSMAAIGLMDLGKQAELINLLNVEFKVRSIQDLPKDSYPAFAVRLRELGANI